MDGKRKSNHVFIFTLIFVPAISIDPKSVNLAVKTSFLFDGDDIKNNATFIHNVQHVINTINDILNPTNTPVYRQNINKEVDDKKVLSNFLFDISASIAEFNDKDIKKIMADLSFVVQLLSNKSNTYNEMFEDEILKKFAINIVKEWAETDPKTLRLMLATFVSSNDNHTLVKFFKILNQFFDENDERKLNKLKKKFDKAKKDKSFKKFILKTIEFVILKRYKRQNFIVKLVFKQELKKFSDFVIERYKGFVEFKPNAKRSVSNIARSQLSSASSTGEFETSASSESSESTNEVDEKNNDRNEISINDDVHFNVRNDM